MSKRFSSFTLSLLLFLALCTQIQAFEMRILGGTPIEEMGINRDWLVRFIDPKSDLAFCTGSLMSQDFVITSFKCIGSIDPLELANTLVGHKGSEDISAIDSVYLPYEEEGSVSTKGLLRMLGETSLTPEEEALLAANKEKQDKQSQSDIVVVKLTKPLVSSIYVTLPKLETIDDYYETNDTAILLGYGVNNLGVEKIGLALETNISIASKEMCDEATQEVLKKYAKEEDKTSTNSNKKEDVESLYICDNALGDKERYDQSIGMCAGDTGAPLIVQELNESNDLNMVQIGLASGFLKDGDSLNCGQNTGYYANLSLHSEWLNQVLTEELNGSEYLKDDELFIDPNAGFYKHLHSLEKETWHLLGAGAMPIGLDSSKIPADRFQIYYFRDNRMQVITQTSKNRLILNLYEGIWLFMEK